MTPFPSLDAKVMNLTLPIINALKIVIKDEWPCVLQNLPKIKNGTLTLGDQTLKNYSSSEDPPSRAVDFMISKGVTLNDLQASFENLQFEDGLIFLHKRQTPIKLTRSPASKISVKLNMELKVTCLAECFPRPRYEYFNGGVKVESDGNVLRRLTAGLKDAGCYECVITQKRSDVSFREVVKFEVNVIKENSITVVTLPQRQEANIGEYTSITAFSKDMNPLDFDFEWYKHNKQTGQIENLPHNPTRHNASLLIPGFELRNAGAYQCHVISKSTGHKIFSNKCELTASTIAQVTNFDLKLAVIIGNNNYELIKSEDMKDCKGCFGSRFTKLLDLNIYSSFSELKKRLEDLGYLVLAFLDLDSDSYLRFLQIAKSICKTAHSASVLIYIAGHGYNCSKEDFLVPIGFETLMHNNSHNIHSIREYLSLCSLNNLLESFKPTFKGQNISVICFWDLCRSELNEWTDISKTSCFNESLNYSIVYCCNVGKKGYLIDNEDKEMLLKPGPILLNVLLNNLKPGLTLHEIAVNMNKNIQALKSKYDQLSSPSIYYSTIEDHVLSVAANMNGEFEDRIKRFYVKGGGCASGEEEGKKIEDGDENCLIGYRFLPDTFVNSLILEIEVNTEKDCEFVVTHSPQIYMEPIKSSRSNVYIYRIRNFLDVKRFNLDLTIIDWVVRFADSKFGIKIKLPERFTQHIFDCMNTPEINKFIKEKTEKAIYDSSDTISVSSVDFSNEEFGSN